MTIALRMPSAADELPELIHVPQGCAIAPDGSIVVGEPPRDAASIAPARVPWRCATAIAAIAATATAASLVGYGAETAFAWICGAAVAGVVGTTATAYRARRLAAELGVERELSAARFAFWRATTETLTAERRLYALSRGQAGDRLGDLVANRRRLEARVAELEQDLAAARAVAADLGRGAPVVAAEREELDRLREERAALEATLSSLERDADPQARFLARSMCAWISRVAGQAEAAAL